MWMSPDDLLSYCNCLVCPLSTGGRPKNEKWIAGRGTERATIAIVGESPTSSDLVRRRVFSGPSGMLADAIAKQLGIGSYELYYANALLCNYPAGAKPDPSPCGNRLVRELQQLRKLKVVVAMGGLALQSLVGRTAPSKEMYRTFWHEQLQAFVVPAYHTAFAYKEVDAFQDIVWSLSRAKELTNCTKEVLDTPGLSLRVARNTDQCVELLDELANIAETTWVAMDWESDGLDTHKDSTLALGFSYRPGEAIILPIVSGKPERETQMDISYNQRIKTALERVVANPNLRFVFHNGDFDVQLTWFQLGVRFPIHYDTMLADYALDERGGQDAVEGAARGMQIGSHRLKSSAQRYLGVPDWEADIKTYVKTSKTKYSAIPRTKLFTYLGYDVVHTLALREKLVALLDEEEPTRNGYWSPADTVTKLLVPALNEIVTAEIEGIPMNRLKAFEVKEQMERDIFALHANIQADAREAGWPSDKKFNQRSSAHLKTLIYDILNIPLTPDLKRDLSGKPIKTRWPTTKDTLARIRHRSPIFDKILRYRALYKRKSTYVERVITDAEVDGKIHASFKLTVTRTGRLSCRDPNLQNIDPTSKVFYEADVGCEFANADYKQLEVRVAAMYSRDPELIKSCEGDIHGEISKRVFHHIHEKISNSSSLGNLRAICREAGVLAPVQQTDMVEAYTDHSIMAKAMVKELRKAAKPIIFGVLYGREAYSLANGPLQCSEVEAQKYIDNLFLQFSVLAAWLETLKQDVQTYGWLETPTGRRRRFPFLHDEYISRALKQAVNAPVQGFASDICLTAFTKVGPILRERGLGRPMFLVHDAIAYSIVRDRREEAKTVIRDTMENAWYDPQVKFVVDIETGPNYGELH